MRMKRVSNATARAASVAARIVRYCCVCNAETLRPRAYICSHCSKLLSSEYRLNDPVPFARPHMQTLTRYVNTSDAGVDSFERKYINSPIDAGLSAVLADIFADDLRLAVAVAQRRDDVRRYYAHHANDGQRAPLTNPDYETKER